MGAIQDKIEALEAEVARLKASAPATIDPAAEAAWRDDVHRMREAQATRAATLGFSKADIAAMDAACPPGTMRGLIRDNRAVPGQRSALPPSATVGAVREPVPPSGSGWSKEIPFAPSPHARYVDAQLDAQDVKDRRELIEQKAREQAMFKAPEPE